MQEETEELFNEHNEFKSSANETRERVKLLIQLAESVVEKGHTHASTIKQWVSTVDKAYKSFSSRMDKYRFVCSYQSLPSSSLLRSCRIWQPNERIFFEKGKRRQTNFGLCRKKKKKKKKKRKKKVGKEKNNYRKTMRL